jgi:hypothetical protein
MKILKILIISLLFINTLTAENLSYSQDSFFNFNKEDNAYLLENTPKIEEEFTNEYIYTKNKYRYLGVSFGGTIGFMFVAAASLYAMPSSVSNWEKTTLKEDLSGLGGKWKENVKAGPVKDSDDIWLNYIAHPYYGGIYYVQAREAGFKTYESFLYSAFMSTFFWEYGIEAFAEIPSKQDLWITPVIGSMVGELFYQASYAIKKNDAKVWDSKALGYTLLFIMDPAFLFIQRTRLKDYTSANYNANSKNDKLAYNYSSWGFSNNGVMLNVRIPLN